MTQCAQCGGTSSPIRVDGCCFRCHVRSIGFNFVGGGGYGREAFRERTNREFMAEHYGRAEDGSTRHITKVTD